MTNIWHVQWSSDNSHKKNCANSAECANYPNIKVNGVNGEAYNCANNDCANYPGCRGSNYLGYTVLGIIIDDAAKHE